jgi:hypothetical protein
MSARKSSASQTIYQLKITLKAIRPPIWRRVQVGSNTTLGQLHEVVQTVMGWDDYHLHQFSIAGIDYGQPDLEDDFEVSNEDRVKLSQVIPGEKFKFLYTYDFGDSWDHEILVEKVLPAAADTRYPICLTGKRACPPEDCGGPWGYEELLEALQDPEHPEHAEKLEWVGEGFDPNQVDVEEINQQLAALS